MKCFQVANFHLNVNLKLHSETPRAHRYRITKCNPMYLILIYMLVNGASLSNELPFCLHSNRSVHSSNDNPWTLCTMPQCTWNDSPLMSYGSIDFGKHFSKSHFAVQIHKNKWSKTCSIDKSIEITNNFNFNLFFFALITKSHIDWDLKMRVNKAIVARAQPGFDFWRFEGGVGFEFSTDNRGHFANPIKFNDQKKSSVKMRKILSIPRQFH